MPTLGDTIYGTEFVGVIVGGVGPTFRGRGIAGVTRNAAGDHTITLERGMDLSAATGEGSVQITPLTVAESTVSVLPVTTATFRVMTFTASTGVALDCNFSVLGLRFSP